MPPSRRPAPLLQLIKLLLTCDSELRPDITAVLSMMDQASGMPGASHSQMLWNSLKIETYKTAYLLRQTST